MAPSATHIPQFAPSARLVTIFVEGAHGYLDRLKKAKDEGGNIVGLTNIAADDLSPNRVGKIIAERIADVLVSLGGRRQAGVIEDDVIARESFPEQTQEEILELLPVDGDRGHEFCQLLLDEVKAYLKDGGETLAAGAISLCGIPAS